MALNLASLLSGGLALATVALAGVVWRMRVQQRRTAYLDQYPWPRGLLERLRKRRPQLTPRDAELVAQGLRQFFRAYQMSGHASLAMPSQLADDLWHEFILYTKAYDAFCRQAFGRFFHHTPAAVLGKKRDINAGLRRCWWWCCRIESIQPAKPSRLPLLFALDAKFGIPDGYRYVPDCSGVRRDDGSGGTQCAGDFSDASVDGSTDGWGSDGTSGEAGSDGSGDGGCSGGGCGGD